MLKPALLFAACAACLPLALPASAIPAVPAPPAAAPKPAPAQASVAAKTAFGTVPASDKSVVSALDAKALAEAKKRVGQAGSFQGTVTQVYSPKSHSFVALDFAPNYHDALTADIASADFAKFPDLTQLTGKHVVVSGMFVRHGDSVQLAVSRPDGIKIVP